jgi:hypothetical protein
MKKIFLSIALFCLVAVVAPAQERAVGEPNPEDIGVDAAQQKLIPVTVSDFEDPSYWTASIASDQGFISIRRKEGAPISKTDVDKERLDLEKEVGGSAGNFVLGTKVDFYRRAITSFYVYPVKPLPVQGITKTISVWVIGRNFNHVLKVVLEDYYGDRNELTIGKLNFIGWKKMTVAVPPSLAQSDFHYTARMGLKVVGLKVECELLESYGTFYIYFDDLSAVTDLFQEQHRDKDDVPDDW